MQSGGHGTYKKARGLKILDTPSRGFHHSHARQASQQDPTSAKPYEASRLYDLPFIAAPNAPLAHARSLVLKNASLKFMCADVKLRLPWQTHMCP